MTTLKGTEKQIKWAEEIRAKKLVELDELMQEALEEMPDKKDLIEEQARDYKARMMKIEYASQWIDIRNYCVEDIITAVFIRLGV